MKQYIGKFDANKDWFTHTEWVSFGIGIGFAAGILIVLKFMRII